MSFRLLPLFLLLACTGGSLASQQLPDTRFPSYDLPTDPWLFERSLGPWPILARGPRAINLGIDTVDRDYRWEGVVIGGLFLGVAAAYLGNRLCDEDNIADKRCTGATLGGFSVGATVGVVTGGLIASAIPK
jgi:hypothetical protein